MIQLKYNVYQIYLQIIDTYHNPANTYPENSSGVHSGTSDLESNNNEGVNKNFKEGLNVVLDGSILEADQIKTFSMGVS